MKKMLVFTVIACLMVTMFAGCSNGGDDANVITIGVFEPSSGDNGAGGKQEVLGIEYANSKVNTVDIGGETYTVKLKIVDNESSTDKAPSAAATLASAKVSIVLGSYGSGVSIAASEVFRKEDIPVVGVSCTNPQVTEGNTHYFRVCYLDPFQGTVLANYAVENFDTQTAYILTKMGDDYSVGLGKYFKEAFEGLGGTVVEETFQDGNSDFTAFLANAGKANAGVIFAPTSTEAASLIISQAASQGVTIPLLAGDTWDSSVILDAAKDSDVKVAVSTFFDEGDDSAMGSEFVGGFKDWLNADNTKLSNNGGNDIVAAVSALGYDAYMTAIDSIVAADSADPVAINEALWNVSYTGVTGNIQFDQTGDAIRDVAYIKSVNTSDGTWKFEAIQSVK